MEKMLEVTLEMKVFLLDKQTTKIVSALYSRMEVSEREVFLLQRIDAGGKREMLPYLKCVVFIEPSSIQFLFEELKEPKYCEYHIFFNDFVSADSIAKIADSDVHEVVIDVQVNKQNACCLFFFTLSQYKKHVKEIFLNYFVVNENTFHVNIPFVIFKSVKEEREAQDKIERSIISALVALKQKPLIRYSNSSRATFDISKRVHSKIEQLNKENGIFEFASSSLQPPLLLILDRKGSHLPSFFFHLQNKVFLTLSGKRRSSHSPFDSMDIPVNVA